MPAKKKVPKSGGGVPASGVKHVATEAQIASGQVCYYADVAYPTDFDDPDNSWIYIPELNLHQRCVMPGQWVSE